MTRVRSWAGGLLLALLSLLLAEGALHVLTSRVKSLDMLLTPSWTRTPFISDSLLLWRGNPTWFDHDAWGFRNPSVVSKADVVTLGDSHTYGIGVARSETWPQLLSGQRAYNMAFGGWGPAQAYLQLEPALRLRPTLVIFALYFGNDLVDAFEVVSQKSQLQRFIPPELRDSADALETQDPIAQRAQELFFVGDSAAEGRQEGSLWSLRRFLSSHSRLYALARALWNAVGRPQTAPALLARDLDQALAGISPEQRRSILVYRGREWKTLLTPAYRNLVIDDRDPRIRAGEVATEAMLSEMDSLSRARGVRLLVLLLPTKESVFAPRLVGQDRSASLDSLVQNEKRARDEMTAFFTRRSVAFLDVLPDLQASTAQPFFPDADGHPNQVGHRVIADAVLRRLRAAN